MLKNALRWAIAIATLVVGAALYLLKVDPFLAVIAGMAGTVLVCMVPN